MPRSSPDSPNREVHLTPRTSSRDPRRHPFDATVAAFVARCRAEVLSERTIEFYLEWLAEGPAAAPAHSCGPLHPPIRGLILNCMVQYSSERLDASFAAISDATRRGVLERLGRGDASITDLAQAFHMTLTGMRKHVGVLEQAELVTTAKVGRVRTCRLGPRRLEHETAWIERHRRLWDSRFAELDNVLEELKRKEKVDERNKDK